MCDLHLRSAYVEITNKCNLFCEHCYNNSLSSNSDELPLSTIEKIYIDFHQQNVSNLALSGGEPFLHKNIREVLYLSKQYAVDTQFVTNGVILDKYLAIIRDNPYLNFQISIDGIGNSHNILRGSQIFDKVDRNINLLKQYGKYVVLKTTVNRLNIGEYREIIEYAVSKQIPKISFSLLNLQGRAQGNEKIILKPDEQKKAINDISQLATEYKGAIEITPPAITNSVCPFINNDSADISPRIDAMGYVFLCSMFVNPMYSLGNINDNSLSNIVKSRRTKNVLDYLNAFHKILECQNCFICSICSRGCIAQYLNDMPEYRVDSCSFKRNNLLKTVLEHHPTLSTLF